MIRSGFVMRLLGIDQGYRVAPILNTKGYGLSVIAKLKETKVKKNLYYEMKDKVVEETVQYGRVVKKSRRTKVYGLQSTHEIRNLLIEILKNRVALHKDKFISPTIHKELTGLEVKKSGKVEHSDLGHDDMIFAYLMAMYVWQEGRNLKELFGIDKIQIRTEDSVDDIVELESGPKSFSDMSKAIEAVNKSPDNAQAAKLDLDLMQLQKAHGMTFAEFAKQRRKKEEEHLKFMLQQENVREAYARYYGVPVEAVDPNIGVSSYDESNFSMPKSLFIDFNKSVDEMDADSIYLNMPQNEYNMRNRNPFDEDETLH